MPELQQCVVCGAQVQPEQHLFTPGLGGVVCLRCARGGDPGGPHERAGAPLLPLSVNALKVLRFFRDHAYDDVRGLRIDGALMRELERVEGGYIRYLLEREVQQRGVFEPAVPAAAVEGLALALVLTLVAF